MDEHPEHPEPPEPPERPDAPDFGPGGYLPERAGKRARKIVLRAPMGIQWVIGSLVVGVVVVVAGWLALRDSAPTEPFIELPGVIGDTSILGLPAHDLIATDAGGRPRAFEWQEWEGSDHPLVVYCEESGLLEATDGRAWRVTGRGTDGTASLVPYRTTIHEGRFYADPTTTLEPLPPDPDPVATACVLLTH